MTDLDLTRHDLMLAALALSASAAEADRDGRPVGARAEHRLAARFWVAAGCLERAQHELARAALQQDFRMVEDWT